jgi:hypothetical protein
MSSTLLSSRANRIALLCAVLAVVPACFRGADVSKIVCNNTKYCPGGYTCVVEAQKIEGRCEKIGDSGAVETAVPFDSGAEGASAMKDSASSGAGSLDGVSFVDGPGDVNGVAQVDVFMINDFGTDTSSDPGASALDSATDTFFDMAFDLATDFPPPSPDLALDLQLPPPDLALDLSQPPLDLGSDLSTWVPGPCSATQPLISDMEENNPGNVSGFWNGCIHGFWWDSLMSGPGTFPPPTLTPPSGTGFTYTTGGCPTPHCVGVVAAGDFSEPYYFGWMVGVTLNGSYGGGAYVVDASAYQGIVFTAQAIPQMSVHVMVTTVCTEFQRSGGTCTHP